MKRFATAKWQGTGKEGKGTVTSQSGLFNNAQYSYSSRFEEGVGTNPEELVAAAHAGCFSMKLSFVLGEAGITPDSIETRCTVTLEGGAVTKSHLEVKVSAPGLDKAKLDECAANAKENCPISKLLNTNITMEASLA
ncbi:MAG TPA: OsmC family protein [Chitinophagaceae bacterium]|jgi:peroxiredoxin, OsmC subfamily